MSSVSAPPVCRRAASKRAVSSVSGQGKTRPASQAAGSKNSPRVAGLGQSVGVQQQRRPARKSLPHRRGGQASQFTHPEGQREGLGGEGAERAVGMQQQGRRVAAVDDAYDVLAVRNLGEDRGREPLGRVDAVAPGARARQRPLQALRDALQGRLLLGRLPERPDHRRDGGHRGHPLPPYVPDDQPYAVRGVLHGVQIPADERVLLRRLVPGRDLQSGDPRLGLGQHGTLRELGDLPDGGEPFVAAPDDRVDEDGEDRGHRHGDHLGDRVHLKDDAEDKVGDEHGADGEDAGENGSAQRIKGCGDQGRGREQGAAVNSDGVR